MDVRDLYQQLILDHNSKPRNFGSVECANHRAEGVNPLCGDSIEVTLFLDENDCIRDVAFAGSGCAISKASASIMTDAVKGKKRAQAEAMFSAFHAMVTGKDAPPESEAPLDAIQKMKLEAFAGVRNFPARVKCATLAWHTLHAALENADAPVTTE